MPDTRDILTSTEVAISTGHAGYPDAPPYGPDEAYPEYPFDRASVSDRPNHAYRAVRDALRLTGLDAANFGRREWNPLGEFIRPGQTVVLKPNFVRDFRETQHGDGDCLITHGSIIRAALDYAFIAAGRTGKLIVADASQNDADFDAVRRIAGIDAILALYNRLANDILTVYDLRPEKADKIDGVIVGHSALPGDPAGYVKVDLGDLSEFAEINHLCGRLYGAEYDMGELHRHHNERVHEYLISRTILSSDCVIGLPKLKTHKKTALTVNMKNLVGINGNKNWLPHHREGTPDQGGDQFANDSPRHKIERAVLGPFKRLFPLLGPLRTRLAGPIKSVGKRLFGDSDRDTVRSGNWYGNDTTWRMVIDLNRVLMHADADGTLHAGGPRTFFSIVDAIVAGEGNGPLDATPKPVGLVIAGRNPVAVDLACARLMGFDHRRLPLLRQALADHPLPLARFGYDDVTVRSDDPQFAGRLVDYRGRVLAFRPHFGWAGHVEINERDDAAGILQKEAVG